MSPANHHFQESNVVDAGFARLHHVHGLVLQIAGRPSPAVDAALDRSALVSGAYGDMTPIAQRRFDTLVAEASAWAAAGLDALAHVKDPRRQSRAAARRLADDLERALGNIAALLRHQAG